MVNAAVVDKRRAAKSARGKFGGSAHFAAIPRPIISVASGERWSLLPRTLVIVRTPVVVRHHGKLNTAGRKKRAKRCTAEEAAKRKRHREE